MSFHPFRQGGGNSDSSAFAFERPADPSTPDSGKTGWFGNSDEGEGFEKKGGGTKNKIFVTVAVSVAALLILTVAFSSLLPHGKMGIGSLGGFGFGLKRKHQVESQEEYDLPVFADEEAIKDADAYEKHRPRDVREANRELGFFRNLFCRGLKRASFCD